MQLGKWMQ